LSQLTGQDRYNLIDGQYRQYHGRVRLAWVIVFVASIVSVLLVLLGYGYFVEVPSTIRSSLGAFAFFLWYGSLLFSSQLAKRARGILPPLEDRALYHLKSALDNLKAFVSHGEENYRRKAVKEMTAMASTVDTWTWGNLKFQREGEGSQIYQFKINLRGRLIPFVKKADQAGIQSLFMWLTAMENTFEMGNMNEVNIQGWNKSLTQHDPVDSMKELFPYEKPQPSRFRKLLSRRMHLGFLLLAIVATPLTYYVIVDFSLASHDAAAYSAIGVLAIIVTAYTTYFAQVKQK
jgi:hypothetical protein